MSGRRPDYILALLDQPSQRKNNNAGGGWIQPDGRISLRLSPGVILSGNDGDMMVSLFPYVPFAERTNGPAVDYFMTGQPAAAQGKKKTGSTGSTGSINDMDDDIPF